MATHRMGAALALTLSLTATTGAWALSCIDPCWDQWRELSAMRVDDTVMTEAPEVVLPEVVHLRYNAYGEPMELEVDGVTLRFDWQPVATEPIATADDGEVR